MPPVVHQFAAAAHQDDPELLLAALANSNPFALEYASPRLRGSKAFMLAAVEQDGNALWSASARLKADREVVIEAVLQVGAPTHDVPAHPWMQTPPSDRRSNRAHHIDVPVDVPAHWRSPMLRAPS